MTLSFGGEVIYGGTWGGSSYTVENLNPTAGSLIIIGYYVAHGAGSTANFSISDNGTGSVYNIIQLSEWNAATADVYVIWGIAGTGVTNVVITPTSPYNVSPTFVTGEYWLGTGTINAVDASNSTNGSTTPGSIVTNYANEVIYIFAVGSATADLPAGYIAGYTQDGDVDTGAQIIASPGSLNPTWGASATYNAIVAFADISAAPTPTYTVVSTFF